MQTPWGVTCITTASGRGVAEISSLVRPRRIDSSLPAIMFAHGANGQATDLTHPLYPNLSAKVFAAAKAGFVVLIADFAGQNTLGNDAVLANYETWWAWLSATGLCRSDKFIACGASMGTLTSHRMAVAHPSQVAGIGCFIPFLDVEYARTNDLLGLRALTNTAWGLPVGSYIGGTDQTPVPSRGLPLSNAAAVSAIPTHLWYSTADSVSTNIDTYAGARTGVTLHQTSTSLGHSDGAVGTDNQGFVDFLNAVKNN